MTRTSTRNCALLLVICAALAASPAPARAGDGSFDLVDDPTPYVPVPEAEQAFFEGNRLLQADRPAEAIPLYERALALDPGLVRVRYYLAQALHEVGRNAAALEVLDGYLSSPIGDRERAQGWALRSRIAPAHPGPGLEPGGGGERSRAERAAGVRARAARRDAAAGVVLLGTGAGLAVAGIVVALVGRDLVEGAIAEDDATAYTLGASRYYGGIALAAAGGATATVGTVLLVRGVHRGSEASLSLAVSPRNLSLTLSF
ncbi:tetratricopeptide repeat protein [Myxococcota bacterium]|nr:tetratricopeptide repeat protein [Myxococcota bacterium]